MSAPDMNEQNELNDQLATPKTVLGQRPSIVWLIPLVALVVACWLGFKALDEKGPTITITFNRAEGLEAGKTKIRYRDVEIGKIDKINLSKDLDQVEVTAQLVAGSEIYLTDQTRFWVVRARVSGGTVSGLTTLLSGAYIGIDPATEGEPTSNFVGLETPPVVTVGQPGRHFLLKAPRLGSLDIGAPIYYRQIQVGQVVGYNLADDGAGVELRVFIEAPHHHRITSTTRFYNASGINVSLNARGLEVDTESMISILSGGIAFDQPEDTPPGEEMAENSLFHLYPDRAAIQEPEYSVRSLWKLYFDQSVRGLTKGAPVELFGIKVGEVSRINLQFDVTSHQFRVMAVIAVEPERIVLIQDGKSTNRLGASSDALMKEMVEEHGLRAQLQTGNLLTGKMIIGLAFFPDAETVKLSYEDAMPVVPTIPTPFEQLQESMTRIVGKLENFPFQQLGEDVHTMLGQATTTLQNIDTFSQNFGKDAGPLLRHADEAIQRVDGLVGQLNEQTVPGVQQSLQQLQQTMQELQKLVGQDSPLAYSLKRSMDELSRTLRSATELIDQLNRRPQSLLFGKERENDGSPQ